MVACAALSLFAALAYGQPPDQRLGDEDRIFDRIADRVDQRVDRRMANALDEAADVAEGKVKGGEATWVASALVAALTRFIIAVCRKVVHLIVAAAIVDVMWSYWWLVVLLFGVFTSAAGWAGYLGGKRAAKGAS